MEAAVFSEQTGLQYEESRPKPETPANEALVKVLRAGICSTDIEILRGYVPGYCHVLGHEFVGVVESCNSRSELVGRRVVGEINCRDKPYSHADPIMVRNHAEGRTVLGIIGRDGTMAQYTRLPAENLFCVPDGVSDAEAAFAEPLAAACRIIEQQVIAAGSRVAVIGDGKLGLMIAQLLVVMPPAPDCRVVLFGRHQSKLDLVSGCERELVAEDTATAFAQSFDVSIEACGAPGGMALALALTRPLGTVVLKSTCSLAGHKDTPQWSAIANDVVVQEKRIVGSRCGPFPPALEALQQPLIKQLLAGMLHAEYPLKDVDKAFEHARTKGTLKVQLVMA